MKNKSSQELLNEILLHMKYDSSMTLSENKEMLMEQNTFYYDNLGNLKGGGPIQVPAGVRKASQLFPNLNQSQYPKKISPNTPSSISRPTQQTQIPRAVDTRSYSDNTRIVPQVAPQSLPQKNKKEEFLKGLRVDISQERLRLAKANVPQKDIEKSIQTLIYRKSTQNGFDPAEISQIINKPLKVEKPVLTPKSINVGFSDNFEIPATTQIFYWNTNDHTKPESFKNSVTFKSGGINDWMFYISNNSQQNKLSKEYNMPIGKVKGFTFNYKGVDLTFKRTVTSNEFLNEFGTILNGNYVPYRKSDYLAPTFWEKNGPTILNIASIAVAVLGLATWPLLLASAGLDLGAAKMQYEQGDVEGAKLSALLALTPFLGKFAIKVPKTQADALARKFVNATTKQDVDLIVSQLSKDELNTLKSLRELGDINQIKKMVNDPEVKKAISDAAKQSSGIPKTSLVKTGYELGIGGSALLTKLPDIKQQELENLTRKQAIDYYVIKIAESPAISNSLTKEELDYIKNPIEDMAGDWVTNLVEKSKIIKRARERKRKQEFDRMDKEAQEKWNEVDRILEEKLKDLEEPLNNVESGRGDEKLTPQEIEKLTN